MTNEIKKLTNDINDLIIDFNSEKPRCGHSGQAYDRCMAIREKLNLLKDFAESYLKVYVKYDMDDSHSNQYNPGEIIGYQISLRPIKSSW